MNAHAMRTKTKTAAVNWRTTREIKERIMLEATRDHRPYGAWLHAHFQNIFFPAEVVTLSPICNCGRSGSRPAKSKTQTATKKGPKK